MLVLQNRYKNVKRELRNVIEIYKCCVENGKRFSEIV